MAKTLLPFVGIDLWPLFLLDSIPYIILKVKGRAQSNTVKSHCNGVLDESKKNNWEVLLNIKEYIILTLKKSVLSRKTHQSQFNI